MKGNNSISINLKINSVYCSIFNKLIKNNSTTNITSSKGMCLKDHIKIGNSFSPLFRIKQNYMHSICNEIKKACSFIHLSPFFLASAHVLSKVWCYNLLQWLPSLSSSIPYCFYPLLSYLHLPPKLLVGQNQHKLWFHHRGATSELL